MYPSLTSLCNASCEEIELGTAGMLTAPAADNGTREELEAFFGAADAPTTDEALLQMEQDHARRLAIEEAERRGLTAYRLSCPGFPDAFEVAADSTAAYRKAIGRGWARVGGQVTVEAISPEDEPKPTPPAPAAGAGARRGMTAELLLSTLRALGVGTPVVVEARTAPAMKKAANPFAGRVVKLSRVEAIANADYAGLVNARRVAEGKPADFVPEARRWGRRLAGGIVEHNGRLYVELMVERSACRYETLDGQAVPAEMLRPYLRSSDAGAKGQGNAEPIILRTYAIDGIVAITIDGVRHELASDPVAVAA